VQLEDVFEGQAGDAASSAAPTEMVTVSDNLSAAGGSMTARSHRSGGGDSDRSSRTGGSSYVNQLMNSSIFVAKVRFATACSS
jgi:hypothetical protein